MTDDAQRSAAPPAPQAEPLDTPEDYGLSELGADHWPLDDVMRRINDGRSWWITSVRPDGRPHAVPVWGVVLEQRILFSSGPASVKSKNIEANRNVVMHLESGDQVVIVEGAVADIAFDSLPAGFAPAYNTKYDIELDFSDPNFQFLEVNPTKIMAWDEAAFAETAARWRFTS